MNRMVIRQITLGCAAAWFLLVASPAYAHFLFIRITPPAEAGRAAEVYFSERATAGDSRFIDKVAATKLWRQTTPGKFEPLAVGKAADRLRAHLPADGTAAVVGICNYGVLARPGQTPFLLKYIPKALAGNAEELNQLEPRPDTPLEIVARFVADAIELTALADGRPLGGAVFHTIDDDLANEELTAGDDGRIRWTPSGTGNFSVYVEHVRREPGKADGKPYDEIREFATLNFNWPLTPGEADAEAVRIFEEALTARAQWQGFPGFTAKIAGQVDGREFAGTVNVAADGAVSLATDDEATREWVDEQLGSITMHRAAGGSSPGRPKPRLWFADRDDEHPLGRLLIFDGGQFASSYRVRQRQITVVNRHLGERDMTITVLDNDVNAEGKFLPRSYTVQYWNAQTGALERCETVQDRWQRVGAFDLPLQHVVTAATGEGLSVRSFVLSDYNLEEKGM
ncbi:MAG TPA: DUF3386 family protein [Pirellulales bacterium]|nr:DUF3386 family protein [Pirellulales bacterium]